MCMQRLQALVVCSCQHRSKGLKLNASLGAAPYTSHSSQKVDSPLKHKDSAYVHTQDLQGLA